MIETIIQTIGSYWDFYRDFVVSEWQQMTPTKYASLLIGIGIFGWLLMKSGTKQY